MNFISRLRWVASRSDGAPDVQWLASRRPGGWRLLGAWVGATLLGHTAGFPVVGINTPIPDGTGTGLTSAQTIGVGVLPGTVTGITVGIEISGVGWSGAYNGDLFVSLRHDSGFAVLLNRPGRSAGNAWGYGDNGFSVTFDDTAGTPDVHTYQITLGGAPGGALTGTWSADGRTDDPGVVTDASARVAGLDSFLGLDPAGSWTLFLADLEPGGQASLDAWRLDLTTTIVPEPTHLAHLTALGWVAWMMMRGGRRPARRD